MAKRKQATRTPTLSGGRISALPGADHWARSAGIVVLGCLGMAFSVQSVLGSKVTSTPFLSETGWVQLCQWLDGQIQVDAAGSPEFCDVPFVPVAAALLAVSIVSLVVFMAAARIVVTKATSSTHTSRQVPVVTLVCRVADSGWRWWLLPWLWELARIVVFAGGFETAMMLMTALYHYVIVVSFAGWGSILLKSLVWTEAASDADSPAVSSDSSATGRPVMVSVAVVTFTVVFTAMNWQLFRGLLVPHGDTVMYEEHLWNVLHGKGFRSYLDQGLFLGEHIQVIHLALLPVYAIWPSHLLLELSESAALAIGAFPVYWITHRATGSHRSATCLAMAYLLYAPLQFLDIAIDLKTFRPISFGVPAMLFALDQLERGRTRSAIALFVTALAAKEDFALILAPLGFWTAVESWRARSDGKHETVAEGSDRHLEQSSGIWFGAGLFVASGGYLLLTTRVLIPWFRDGAEVHYARYFAKFGDSLGEIVINMLTSPGLLIEELVTFSSVSYLLALLLPLAFLPLLSPARFCVAGPVLGLLCLNEIVKGDPQPHHHFHAPVIPILFWAAAHSLKRFQGDQSSRVRSRGVWLTGADRLSVPVFVLLLCLSTGALAGLSPLSIRFWDSGSFYYWKNLYVPSERAERFPVVLDQIPIDARVASTDFVHPRFTHHERSYDYSHYLRKVAGYENQVPEDTDFIVIDTRHHYSDIRSPADVRELQTEPEKWELLEDQTGGYFIILKRRR